MQALFKSRNKQRNAKLLCLIMHFYRLLFKENGLHLSSLGTAVHFRSEVLLKMRCKGHTYVLIVTNSAPNLVPLSFSLVKLLCRLFISLRNTALSLTYLHVWLHLHWKLISCWSFYEFYDTYFWGNDLFDITGVDDTWLGMHDLPLALRLMCSECVTSDSLSFAPPAVWWLAKTNSHRCHNTGQDVSAWEEQYQSHLFR